MDVVSVQYWAEMVAVPWPQDPLRSADQDGGVRARWVVHWLHDDRPVRVNGIDCNPHDRVRQSNLPRLNRRLDRDLVSLDPGFDEF